MTVSRFTREGAVAPDLSAATQVFDRLLDNIETVVVGKRDVARLVLAAFACRGHVLLEDVPGTAKTILARAIAASLQDAVSARIQCTPDLQPTDVTGLSVWDPQTRRFEFRPGPVFANVLLVDEINRALPKAQSALLEAMAEQQVTADGVTRSLPDPFLLIATENPIEQEGTFPLPEAQLDRFFLRTSLGYPTAEEEVQILDAQLREHPVSRLKPVVSREDVVHLFAAVNEVYVDPLLKRWTVDLVRATRELDLVDLGASVRGSLALERAARAWALAVGREYVVPDDIELLFAPVLGHRLILAPDVLVDERVGGEDVLQRIWEACLERAPRPGPEWEPATAPAG